MWNVKTKVIPIIIGEAGTTSESFRKYLSNIPGKHDIKELQRTVILGTAHILRNVLMQMYRTFNVGNCITCSINCTYRIAAKLHTSESCFFRYIIVNTLHGGDNE
jgi:hypothetical protein